MFDIGFWEIVIIAVLALVIAGPERLPGIARTIGTWTGRGRAMLRAVKTELDREVMEQEMKSRADNSPEDKNKKSEQGGAE